MVESAFEFAEICRKHDYHNFVFSMKASNPLVMVQVGCGGWGGQHTLHLQAPCAIWEGSSMATTEEKDSCRKALARGCAGCGDSIRLRPSGGKAVISGTVVGSHLWCTP
jgi:hypothetical protein